MRRPQLAGILLVLTGAAHIGMSYVSPIGRIGGTDWTFRPGARQPPIPTGYTGVVEGDEYKRINERMPPVGVDTTAHYDEL